MGEEQGGPAVTRKPENYPKLEKDSGNSFFREINYQSWHCASSASAGALPLGLMVLVFLSETALGSAAVLLVNLCTDLSEKVPGWIRAVQLPLLLKRKKKESTVHEAECLQWA